jgi:hypothetical protein
MIDECEQKFREAAFFLGMMKSATNDQNALPYYYSAFLSASRSVLEHSLAAFTKQGKQAKYDKYIASPYAESIRFFESRRDSVVDRKPVEPNLPYPAETTLQLLTSGTIPLTYVYRGEAGQAEETATPASEAAERALSQPNRRPSGWTHGTTRFCLADRPKDDLIDLSVAYLNELLGFLTWARREGVVTAP